MCWTAMPFMSHSRGYPDTMSRVPTTSNRPSIIARFFTNSLTTKEFKWLHQEAWNEQQLDYFAAERATPPTGLAKDPPFETGRKRLPPVLAGRWALEFEKDVPVAWAEVWAFERKFGILHLNVSPCTAPGGWSGASLEALSFLISGIFLMSGADLLRLGTANHKEA